MLSRSLMAGAAGVLAATTAVAGALLDTQASSPSASAPKLAATPRAASASQAPSSPKATTEPRGEADFKWEVDGEAIEREVEAAMEGVNVDAILAQAMRGVEGVFGGTPRLGISVRDLTADEATQASLGGITGAWVTSVVPESAAAKAGLADGDVVVAIDGETVRSARHLTRIVSETPAGRALPVEYVRGGQRAQVTVTPEAPRSRVSTMRGRAPADFAFKMSKPMILARSRARLGVGVFDLTPQLSEYFGVKDGVLVTEVSEGSPAARGGLKAGDVITRIADTAVADVSDISQALAASEAGGTVAVEVSRNRTPVSLSVTVDKTPTAAPLRLRPRGRTTAD